MKRLFASLFFVMLVLFPVAVYSADTVPTDIQQPGTQPNEIGNLESPNKCDNCHGGYNSSVEPAHNWRGSMMAHAGRDPIFWATLAIAEQDFDGAGDLCIRCHSTGGWLAGRSTPTDGSGLAAGDSDGVECDYCHKLTNPDNSEHQGVMNAPFVANDGGEGYHGSGMSAMWGGSDKLGPYDNADARHQFMQSTFHRDPALCGTCHDVSNPAVGDLAANNGVQDDAATPEHSGIPGAPVDGKAAFNNPPYAYGIVERTFSEFMAGQISQTLVSDYPTLPAELRGGALEAIYNAAGGGNYEDGTDRYFTCQSCHMRPVTGEGANKRGVPVRTDLPLHDMTGGNYWMPEAIKYLDGLGKLRLGGGMSAIQVNAMLDGALRAKQQLELAATLTVANNGSSVRIVNHTGHKLISGYPEGRRMWLNIKWYDGNGALLREDGKYGDIGVTVNDVTVRSLIDLKGTNTKIYEAHMGLTREWAAQLVSLGWAADLPLGFDRITGEPSCLLGELAQVNGQGPCSGDPEYHESFHFVLNNAVVSDNRIPPYGMSYDHARIRNALPVPADQYSGAPGGTYDYFDDVALSLPSGAQSADIKLMYQPTSWEYIQFLTLANNGSDPAAGGNAFLGEEGTNLLEAWLNTGMAEPHVMASATWGSAGGDCTISAPTLLSAGPGDAQVTLAWQALADAPDLAGYRLYFDQNGKSQPVADLPCTADAQDGCTSYTQTDLTNGQQYCYEVTAYTASCESGYSNILCATPTNPGQAEPVSVDTLTTGKWIREGKGKNATTTFLPTADFVQGDGVVIQAEVSADGAYLSGATVAIEISGPQPQTTTVATLISGSSDGSGIAEVTWNTSVPNKKGNGGTDTGVYTATVTAVTASGFAWDEAVTTKTFTLGQ